MVKKEKSHEVKERLRVLSSDEWLDCMGGRKLREGEIRSSRKGRSKTEVGVSVCVYTGREKTFTPPGTAHDKASALNSQAGRMTQAFDIR